METKVDIFNSPMVRLSEVQTECRQFMMPTIIVQLEIYPENDEEMQIYTQALYDKMQGDQK